MGNNQSTGQLGKSCYLAISPYPLVSVVNKPARTLLTSTTISSSNNDNKPCDRNAEVIKSDHCCGKQVVSINGDDDCDQHCRLGSEEFSNPLSCQQSYKPQKGEISSNRSPKQLKCLPVTRSGTQSNYILNDSKNTSSPLHQHLLNTKATPHASMDGCNECVSQGKISDSCSSQHHCKTNKLVQNIIHTKIGTKSMVVDSPIQLSMTESTLDEMVEAIQNVELHEDELVERGGLCGPPGRRLEENRITRDRVVETQSEDGGSEAQTGQREVIGGFLASNSGSLDNRLVTVLNRPIRNNNFCETGTCESTATNAHNLDCHEPTISDLAIRNDSFLEATTSESQIYVDPKTGEFHSMVFGSFAGERMSIFDGAGTFCQTQRIHSVVSGDFINSGRTECFSNVNSRDSFNNSVSDFIPNNNCSVIAGRVDPFDSSDDQDQSFSGEQDKCVSSGEISGCQDVCRQSNKSPKKNSPSPCSAQPDIGRQSPPRIKRAVSNCESCDFSRESSLAQTFGNSGSICESCSCVSQSFAANTNSFTVVPSSIFKSQCSNDSWSESSPKLVILQTTGDCFNDYDDDSQDLFRCHDNCSNHSYNCCQNKIGSDMNNKCGGLSGTQMKVEDCEIATEDFGIDREPHSAHSAGAFGQQSFNLCSKTIASQLVAESKIRGTDTEEFDFLHSDHTASSDEICYPIKTMRSDNLLCSEGNKLTTADIECSSGSWQQADDTDYEASNELTDDSHHSPNFAPKQKSFNNPFLFKKDKQMQNLQDNLNNKMDDRYHGRNVTIPSPTSDNLHVDGCDNGCLHNNGTKSKEHGTQRQDFREKMARTEPDRQEDRACHMKFPHRGLHLCDCLNPFKQNYVAYLCCAPDDLIRFGVAFHKTLEMWGFRIFIAARDLELTGPKYENMARWLEDRCNGKIIVVLSQNYGKSDECLFLTYFARTLDPDARNRNIIPVMIDRNVEVPNVLKGLSIIKYKYDSECGWLKKKLVNAIAA